MISSSAINVAAQLGNILAEDGKSVQAIPGTPLDELVKLCRGTIKSDSFDVALAYATDEEDNNVYHDDAMDEIVRVSANSVAESISRARNVVMPMVRELHALIAKEVDVGAFKALNPVNIVQLKVPGLVSNSSFVNAIEPFAGEAYVNVPVVTSFPRFSDEELLELIKSNGSSLAEGALGLVADSGIRILSDVWACSFAADATAGDMFGQFGVGVDGMSKVALIYLFARALNKADPIAAVNMGAEEYRNYVTTVMTQAARQLNTMIGRFNSQVSRKQIVSSYPALPPEQMKGQEINIYVNKDIFDNWVAVGNGSAEVIMGAYFTGVRITDAASLTERSKELADAWVKYERIFQQQMRANTFSRSIAAINKVMRGAVAGFDTSETGISVGKLYDNLSETLDMITQKDLGDTVDLMAVTRDVVCNVFFQHTNAKQILRLVDQVGKENPGMDMREVTARAVMVYVFTWAAELTAVKAYTPTDI